MTGPSTAVFAAVMASGNRVSMALATSFSSSMSGSMSSLLLPFFPALIRGPVQNTLLPNVKEPTQHENDKKQHFEKSKKPELPVNNGPGIQENGFNIKQDEHHCDQIKLDAKPPPGIANRLHAGFIRRRFHGVADPPPEDGGRADHAA